MKTIVLATDRKFWRQEQGSAKRISDLYRYLQEQGFTIFVFLVGKINENDLKLIQKNHQDFNILSWRHGLLSTDNQLKFHLLRFSMLLKGLLKKSASLIKTQKNPQQDLNKSLGKEVTITDFHNEEYLKYFRQACAEIQPDYIIVEYIRLAYLIKNLRSFIPNQPLTLVDTHDVMHQRYQRFQQSGTNSELKITQQEEKQQLNLFDVIIAIQNKDREILTEMVPDRRVIEVGYTTEVKTHLTGDRQNVNITYVAGPNIANKHGIIHFIENIWNQLHAKFKNKIQLNIVGRVCEVLDNFNPTTNINLVGWTDNLSLVYSEADIVINPIYFGTGLKIKNVEALCNSKPLVTTTVGAEGLEHGKNEAFLVCDRVECTYEKLSELIEQPSLRKSLAQKAYTFAQNNFTDEKVYQELSNVLTTHA